MPCKECGAEAGQVCWSSCQTGADIFESQMAAAGEPGYTGYNEEEQVDDQ